MVWVWVWVAFPLPPPPLLMGEKADEEDGRPPADIDPSVEDEDEDNGEVGDSAPENKACPPAPPVAAEAAVIGELEMPTMALMSSLSSERRAGKVKSGPCLRPRQMCSNWAW